MQLFITNMIFFLVYNSVVDNNHRCPAKNSTIIFCTKRICTLHFLHSIHCNKRLFGMCKLQDILFDMLPFYKILMCSDPSRYIKIFLPAKDFHTVLPFPSVFIFLVPLSSIQINANFLFMWLIILFGLLILLNLR